MSKQPEYSETATQDMMSATTEWDVQRIIADLQAGANPNTRLKSKMTILHLATTRNDLRVVKKALAHGAKILANNNGKTPIDIARNNCHHRILQVLESHQSQKEGKEKAV